MPSLITKELHGHEQDLLELMNNMYSTYWETKTSRAPVENSLNGKYWDIEFRVKSREGMEPLIEKKVYFKKPDGERTRVTDNPGEGLKKNPNLQDGLGKIREIVERVAFFTTAYNAGERGVADIKRITEATSDLDIFHSSDMGRTALDLTHEIYPDMDINDGVKIIAWETGDERSPLIDALIKEGKPLQLPPNDNGYPRTETLDEPINLTSARNPEGQKHHIQFGDIEN